MSPVLCLDNSVLRKYAKEDPDPVVVDYLADRHAESWSVPAVVTYEFYRIAETPQDVRRARRRLHAIIDDVLPYTDAVAAETATLETTLEQQDVHLDIADLLHAATAREAGATFVTADANDFDRPPIHDLLDLEIVRPA